MAGAADWAVVAVAIVLLLVVRAVARWKSGRHRRLRITVVIEHDYEGPGQADR